MDPLAPLAIPALVGLAAACHARHIRRTPTRARATSPTVRSRTTARPKPSPQQPWTAAEQTGWQILISAGRLRIVAGPVPDPGNPGHHLTLAEHVAGALGAARVLLAVNPNPGPDGRPQQVALPVPAHLNDPIAAAAWTYDDPTHPLRVTPAVYAGLTRRT